MLNRRAFTSTLTLGGMSTILPKSSDANFQPRTTCKVDTELKLLPDLNQIIKKCCSDNEEGYYWGQVLASIVLPNILRYIDKSTHIDMNLSIDTFKINDNNAIDFTPNRPIILVIEHCDRSVFKNIELYRIDELFCNITNKFCIEIKQKCIKAIAKPYIFLDITQENKLGFGLHCV